MSNSAETSGSESSLNDFAPILPELSGPDTVIREGRASEADFSPHGEIQAQGSGPGVPGSSVHPDRHLPAVADDEAGARLLAELFAVRVPGYSNGDLSQRNLRLRQFVIERLIGAGGMGAVFRATDETLKRTVALKVLAPNYSRDTAFVRRFLNEAQSCARLNHENIARIFFVGEDRGVHFIAFEYVDGINLLQTIRSRKTLRPAEALNVGVQIAFALAQTNAAGVIHRDIKPSNIILTPQGRAKLVDLGLARKEGDDSLEGLTVAGATLGTFDYISPEQARDARNVDVRSDIYSLGCTLFHMLTGVPPYQDGTPIQKLLDHQDQVVPEVSTLNPAIKRELSALVRKMMNPDPARRQQTPEELINDLMQHSAHLGLRGLHPDGMVWMKTAQERQNPFQKFAGLAASFVLLVLLAIFVRSGRAPEKIGSVWPVQDEFKTSEGDEQQNNISAAADEQTPPPGDAKMSATESTSTTDSVDNNGLFPDGFQFPMTETVNRMKGIFSNPDRKDSDSAESPRTETTPPSESRSGDSLPAIVIRDDDEDRIFATIESAALAASDGDVIILQYNGLRPENDEIRPLRITNKRITIRGETGYRPIIRFRLAGREDQTRMMTLMGGRLDLVNLDIEFVVPETSADVPWSLISLQGTEQVRLNGVNIRVANSSNQPATVFELIAGSAARLTRMNADGSMPDEEFSIDINRSWINGRCDLFHVRSTIPGDLNLANSAVVVDGNLLLYEGDSSSETQRGRIDVQAEHVTCVVGQSLLRVVDSDTLAPGPERNVLPVHVQATNNIFAGNDAEPLVCLMGNGEASDLRDLLAWSGNKNWYDGFRTFLQIDSFLSEVGPMDDDFESWKSLLSDSDESSEIGATHNELLWRNLRWRERDVESIWPGDLQLQNGETVSGAVGGATDGGDLGADLTQFLSAFETQSDRSESD